MNRDSLVLTLGHNSSAVLVRNDRIIAGYETERLTGVKSDSTFPAAPIEQIRKFCGLSSSVDVYVGHWELFGQVDKMKPKHWDRSIVAQVANGGNVFSVGRTFTHHDSHAWSAIAFAGDGFPSSPSDATYIFVMDGFGTMGEHMSFYRLIDGVPILIERKYGFGSSLGLLYQYTTAFLGMKQNQDEYKLLAFEAHVDKYESLLEKANQMIESYTDFWLQRLSAYMEPDETDPLLDIGALPNTAEKIAAMLSEYLAALGVDAGDLRAKRVLCSYLVQSIVENVVKQFVNKYAPKNLLLVGGLFYNVKLNNVTSHLVPGLTCVMPLAGDQGAGLGLYKAINSDLVWPNHLFWGPRTLSRSSFEQYEGVGIHYFTDRWKAFEFVASVIEEKGFCNVVDGSMEFGPRALCHTTTFAVPTKVVADHVNFVNNRVNEMPFAPVMTRTQADEKLQACDKVHKSLEYMICTRDFRPGKHVGMEGAAHKYPMDERYSARPQITNDPEIVRLLHRFGPLINTSFNYHGVPIVCTDEQIINTHVLERAQSNGSNDPITVVISEALL